MVKRGFLRSGGVHQIFEIVTVLKHAVIPSGVRNPSFFLHSIEKGFLSPFGMTVFFVALCRDQIHHA